MNRPSHARLIEVGRISAVFGVRGWVKLQSFTQPPENLLDYQPWQLCRNGQCRELSAAEVQPHGKGMIARFEGYGDRDAAADLVGSTLCIPREALPPVEDGQYYWSDLMGLRVETMGGQFLGHVDHLLETGANDVLVVEQETEAGKQQRLIPYIKGQVVREIDLDTGLLRVDWDPDF